MTSFLDLFTATDSGGASAARYRLHYLGNMYHNQDSWIFGMGTELLYVLFQWLAVPANAMLGLVLSSGSWLSPLSDAYRKFTAPLFAVAPPWAIACFGMGVVAVSVMMSRPRATRSGMFDTPTLNRVGTALAMMIAVLVLTHNPFAMMTKVLELANGFSVGLAAAFSGSDHTTILSAGQALVDSSIRTPTIALNYGREFSQQCRQLWSEAMASGQALSENTKCFVKGQDEAEPQTIATAATMVLLPALPMLAFSIVAAWKYVLHLTMAVLSMLATGWIAAVNVHRRRGFDRLSKVFSHAGAHLVMAVVTSMVAVALPALCTGLATDLLGLVTAPQIQAYALMVSLGVGFAVSTWVIVHITSNHGALVRLLHANTNTTLEHVLGVDVKNELKDKLKVHKEFNPFAKPDAQPDAASAAGKKTSALAADPVAATAGVDAARRSKGAAVSNTDSADTATDITALIDAAVSVATAASDPPRPTVTAIAAPGPGADTANRTWQQQSSGPDQLGVDTFGHFILNISGAGGTTVTNNGGDPDLGAAQQPATADGTSAQPGPETAPEPTAAEDSVSLLAAPGAVGIGAAGDTPASPVTGNVYADPALDAASRAAGATSFTAAGRPPRGRRLRSWMRSFFSGPPGEPVPFGAPTPQHAPSLAIVAPFTGSAGGAGSDAVDGDAADPVNDQQRWNRMRHLGHLVRRKPVTSPGPAAELPLSGIGPGVNTHPGSFHAPLPDFLAGDALEAEMDEMTTAMAAAGRRINVALDPQDRRIAVRMSSDPAQRVVRVDADGFGDPI